jgi:hypothetical protein
VNRFDPAVLEPLDEPVRRYLAHAIGEGAPLAGGARLTMTGRVRAGAWMPFRGGEDCDGRSFEWRARVALGLLGVVDRFDGETGSTEIRLLGRLRLSRASGEDVTRSAAGRAALEAFWAPAALLPGRRVTWRAEADDHIVARHDLPPEQVEVHLRIDEHGGVTSTWADRWGNAGQDAFGYIPCGGEVRAERRFGEFTVPSSVTVGWWFGTPRYAPFFEAEVRDWSPVATAR